MTTKDNGDFYEDDEPGETIRAERRRPYALVTERRSLDATQPPAEDHPRSAAEG